MWSADVCPYSLYFSFRVCVLFWPVEIKFIALYNYFHYFAFIAFISPGAFNARTKKNAFDDFDFHSV